MGSSAHPHTFLVLDAIKHAIDNVRQSGGVVPAATEARRLAMTYPSSALSERSILAEFKRQAALFGLPTDDDPTVFVRPENDSPRV